MNRTFYQCRRVLCWLLAVLCLLGLLGWFMLYTTRPADNRNIEFIRGTLSEASLHEIPQRYSQILFTLSDQKFRFVCLDGNRYARERTEALKQAGEVTVTFITDWKLWHGKEAIIIETSQDTFGSIEQYNAHQHSERVAGWASIGAIAVVLVLLISLLLFIMYMQQRPKELRGFRGFLQCLFSSRRKKKRKHSV